MSLHPATSYVSLDQDSVRPGFWASWDQCSMILAEGHVGTAPAPSILGTLVSKGSTQGGADHG